MKITGVNGFIGAGTLVALLLLFGVESLFHTDAFLNKYRSVFASGRAMAKLMYVEASVPSIVIAGNSRIDNGFNPGVLQMTLPGEQVFNLGVPGANARIMYGMFKRLDKKNLLGPDAIDYVVIGLDESMFQADDSLAYAVFFADRKAMWDSGEYHDLLGSYIRLWGYADNLKQLKEPAKAVRFLNASVSNVESWGGAINKNLGYRAAEAGEFQNVEQLMRQEVGSQAPPDIVIEEYFWNLIKLLQQRQVNVAVLFPPLLTREVMFLSDDKVSAKPYLRIKNKLERDKIPLLAFNVGEKKDPREFANAGHLNNSGASRYSLMLSVKLKTIWPDVVN